MPLPLHQVPTDDDVIVIRTSNEYEVRYVEVDKFTTATLTVTPLTLGCATVVCP